MRYCKLCIYPESKPHLFINGNGVCSACLNFSRRKEIDYANRFTKLIEILERHHSKDGSNYDCIVPGSGGKDSTYQALRIRELGFNPLIVTATTDHLTELGRYNIENLKNQGFDYVEVTPNPVIRRRIARLALETVGDIEYAEHLAMFTIPIREAVNRGIGLVVYGENSQHEYGGPEQASVSHTIDRRWLEEYGGLNGLRVADLPDMLNLEPKQLLQYQYPEGNVEGIFLGAFEDWDGFKNAEYAKAHGFRYYHKDVEGSLCPYENLDNAWVGIHDYFKWLKFGYGRATDIACNHIRRGRMTREQALDAVQYRDGLYPNSYLGVDLAEILAEIGMNEREFQEICEKFKNKKIHVG